MASENPSNASTISKNFCTDRDISHHTREKSLHTEPAKPSGQAAPRRQHLSSPKPSRVGGALTTRSTLTSSRRPSQRDIVPARPAQAHSTSAPACARLAAVHHHCAQRHRFGRRGPERCCRPDHFGAVRLVHREDMVGDWRGDCGSRRGIIPNCQLTCFSTTQRFSGGVVDGSVSRQMLSA